MRTVKLLVAIVLCGLAGAAAAQNPCGDCRGEALAQHKACNAAPKANAEACGKKMSELMQACQVGACAKDVAKMYEGYCTGCLQQATTPAKKKACEESVCRKAAGK